MRTLQHPWTDQTSHNRQQPLVQNHSIQHAEVNSTSRYC